MSNRYPLPRVSVGVDPRVVGFPTTPRPKTYPRQLRPFRPTRLTPWSPKEFYKPPAWPSGPTGPRVSPVSPAVFTPTGPRIPGWVFRRMLRFLPWLGWGLLAWDLYRLWQQWSNAGTSGYEGKCDAPPEYVNGTHLSWSFSGTQGMCTSQLVPDGGAWSPSSPWLRSGKLFNLPPPFSGTRWWGEEAWLYPSPPAGEPGQLPLPGWVSVPPPMVPPLWALPPLIPPPYSPAPIPIPPPIRDPWPGYPDEDWDPPPDIDPEPPFEPQPFPPGTDLPTWPGVTVGIDPKSPPGVWPTWDPKTDPKIDPRPDPNTRERKLRPRSGSVMRRIMGEVLSGFSEFGDMVDAFYEGVPKSERTKNADLPQKLRDLYNSIDKNTYDVVKGWSAVYQNHQEDKVFGRAFGYASEQFEKYGVDVPFLRDGFTFLVK